MPCAPSSAGCSGLTTLPPLGAMSGALPQLLGPSWPLAPAGSLPHAWPLVAVGSSAAPRPPMTAEGIAAALMGHASAPGGAGNAAGQPAADSAAPHAAVAPPTSPPAQPHISLPDSVPELRQLLASLQSLVTLLTGVAIPEVCTRLAMLQAAPPAAAPQAPPAPSAQPGGDGQWGALMAVLGLHELEQAGMQQQQLQQQQLQQQQQLASVQSVLLLFGQGGQQQQQQAPDQPQLQLDAALQALASLHARTAAG